LKRTGTKWIQYPFPILLVFLGEGFILILMIVFCFAVYISFCWDFKVVLWWEMWLCYLTASGCICTWWVVILISLYSTHCIVN
jgi:hypothetical protein